LIRPLALLALIFMVVVWPLSLPLRFVSIAVHAVTALMRPVSTDPFAFSQIQWMTIQAIPLAQLTEITKHKRLHSAPDRLQCISF
jgi:hypothetical protein